MCVCVCVHSAAQEEDEDDDPLDSFMATAVMPRVNHVTHTHTHTERYPIRGTQKLGFGLIKVLDVTLTCTRTACKLAADQAVHGALYA